MARRFKIANVEMLQVGRRRATPIFLLRKVKAREPKQAPVPPVPRGVHGEDNVIIVLEEGHPVAQGDGGLPPAEVGLAGLVEENRA